MIRIGETLLDASLTRSGDTLTVSMVSDMALDALAALLDPGSAPNIRVLGEDGMTMAIYGNHAVTALTIETVGDARQVTATLRVAPMEQTAEDKLGEQLAKQAGILSEHDAALVEVAGLTATNGQMANDADAALIELAGMVAELMERVGTLEALHAAETETDTTTDGEVS